MLLVRHCDLREGTTAVLERIGQFIGVEPMGFEQQDADQQANVTQYPVSRSLYEVVRQLWKPVDRLVSPWGEAASATLREAGRNWILSNDRPVLSSADREYLQSRYSRTTAVLEEEFGLNLPHWRS
jgi:hypothetical protein